ncbi:hypothetical protein GGH93_003272 [Coemansia aciculifera]|nr:hypothetical protein GGH93_003272 [Coemansia aciculifera]
MSTLSPLQTLPLYVVKRIVDHVVGSIRLGVTDRETDHRWYAYLRPLLAICHNFRAVAYPRFCRHFKLELNDALFCQHSKLYMRTGRRDTGYPSNACLGYPTYHLVKDLEIELEERAIYTGKALRMLSYAPYDDCVFPLVRNLTLSFAWDDHDESDGYYDRHEYGAAEQNVAVKNVSAFVQWIKQKAPMVNEIRIQPGTSVHESGVVTSDYFGDLILQLYQLVDRIDLDSYDGSEVTMDIQLDKICHLTHISYTSSGIGSHFTKLICQNASTLQSLTVVSEGKDVDICDLITNIDGSSVVFPCLLKLKLDIEGNAATLEFLDFVLDSSMVAMIRRYNVFTTTSHPKLCCVKTGYQYSLIPGLLATAAEAIQFSLRIGPTAPVREICEPSADNFVANSSKA